MSKSIDIKESFILLNENATEASGRGLAKKATAPLIVFLEGDLAAGKTTWVRGFLRGMGHAGAVKSPTYTLVEEYEFGSTRVYHFDLYRLSSAKELESIGIREYFTHQSIVLIEWAEKGELFLPAADILLTLTVIPEGRLLTVNGLTEQGLSLKSYLNPKAHEQ